MVWITTVSRFSLHLELRTAPRPPPPPPPPPPYSLSTRFNVWVGDLDHSHPSSDVDRTSGASPVNHLIFVYVLNSEELTLLCLTSMWTGEYLHDVYQNNQLMLHKEMLACSSGDRASWCVGIIEQLDALIPQIYFWNRTPHVSDSFSVHHQWSSTVHTAIHTGYADSLPTGCRQTCLTHTIAVCTVLDHWWWTEDLSETCRGLFQE